MNTSASKTVIIGIGGTNGSGKDSLGLALQKRRGFMFIPFTNLLRDEARHREMPVIRTSQAFISAEWRREFGNDVLVSKSLDQWRKEAPNSPGVVMASLRHPAEADRIHQEGGIVLWLDSDPQVRYRRVQANSANRGDRQAEDLITFEEFLATEQAEMHRSGDDATLDMYGVKERADYQLLNDAATVDEFINKTIEQLSL